MNRLQDLDFDFLAENVRGQRQYVGKSAGAGREPHDTASQIGVTERISRLHRLQVTQARRRVPPQRHMAVRDANNRGRARPTPSQQSARARIQLAAREAAL